MTFVGPDQPGDTQALAQSLATTFGGPVTLDIHYQPSTHTITVAQP